MINMLNETHAFECAALHHACFPAGWDADIFKAWLSTDMFKGFGIFQNEQLVSFVLGSALDGEFEIYTLCTAETYRGQGYAKQLVDFLSNSPDLPDMKTIFLDVREDNIAALALYEKAGFRMISSRVGYYTEGDKTIDAVCMMKNLLDKA